MINVGASAKIKKKHCEKCYIWNPSTCNSENGNCLASIFDASMVTCNVIIKVIAK